MSRIVLGRKQQKEKLDQIIESTTSSFAVVYGRRRVGKTFLIRQYLANNIAFDFTGQYNTATQIQLSNFHQEYIKRTKGKLQTQVPSNWNEAFHQLATYLEKLPKTKKHVIFIDELPWIDNHKSGFLSALEYLWNQHVSQMPHIALIVCGSANAWIQKKLLFAKGGLYNRITHTIHLEPFTLAETEEFLQYKGVKLSRYQLLELYMTMGGIPFYLEQIPKGKSSVQIIDLLCFSKNGLLYNEFNQLYPSIFNNADNHLAIINALASKPQGLTRQQLVKTSKLPDGGIFTRTITELEDSGFVSIHLPLQNKKKEAIYRLADLYSLFYYKFIKGNKQNGPGTWEKLSKKASYTAWSGYAFENICFAHLPQIKTALGISGIYANASSWKSTGNQHFSGAQIDLLIDRDDNSITICECKFSSNPFVINKTYAENLKNKAFVFKELSKTSKSIFTTLITTFPSIKNQYYLAEIQNEITMNDLFL